MLFKNCEYCQHPFRTYPYNIKIGKAKYCSHDCHTRARYPLRKPVDKGDHFEIALTRGKVAKVCKCHVHLIDKQVWSYCQNGYAIGYVDGSLEYMHRIIGAPTNDPQIDHINNDRLDNRCQNLRECTNGQNGLNRGSAERLKYISMAQNKMAKNTRYVVNISKSKTNPRHYYKRFKTLSEAIAKRDEMVRAIHGEFGRV